MTDTLFVDAPDGTRIAYEVTGAGDPLVLVHGITQQRRMFDPLIPRLAESHRVVALDLRGHGESDEAKDYSLGMMAGDVSTVVTHLGLENVNLIGHSLGGAVVTAYAGAFAPRTVINVDQPLALGGFKGQVEAIEPALRSDQFGATMTMLLDSLMGDRLSEDEQNRIRSLQTPKQDVVLGVWDLVLSATVEDIDAAVDQMTGAIDAPYLAIHGIDLGPDYPTWLTSKISGATYELWDGLGHYPHLAEPDRFIARVREFIA